MVPQPRQGVVPAVTVDAGQRGRGLQSVAVHGAAVIPGAGRVARKIRTSEREAAATPRTADSDTHGKPGSAPEPS